MNSAYPRNKTCNPCGEIPLGNWEPVVPWAQVQMMNWLRVRSGQKPYTLEECRQIEAELLDSYKAGQGKTDLTSASQG